MRHALTATLVTLMCGGALAQEPRAQPPQNALHNVEVRHVTLATGGLVQVEGRMAQAGDTMRLAVDREQVADVLRTLVLSGDSPVRAVELAAAQAVGPRTRTGRLLEEDLSTPATMLDALVGEIIEVSAGANQASGRLLGLARITLPGSSEEPAEPALRLSLAGADGRITYVTLPEADPIALSGDAVDALSAALAPALAASVDESRRQLEIRFAGQAEAGFSFVVPTTVWRPSYRALVGEAGVTLQGWATLENTTGLDWSDIELDLAVGTPVAFSQDVYSPLRTARPDAPFEVGRTMETDIVAPSPAREAEAAARGLMAADSAAASLERRRVAVPPPPASAPAALETGGPAEAGSASTVYPVAGRVSLAAGRTLTVPFLMAEGTLRRIAYMTRFTGAAMDALEGAFDDDATLPGGLIAVYDDGRFVGDARFGGADGGERAILPFAISADVDVTATEEMASRLTSARFTDGALVVTRTAARTLTLAVGAAAPVDLVYDLPRSPGEEVAVAGAEAQITALSPRETRLRIALEGGASTITVVGTRPLSERYIVGQIPSDIIAEVRTLGAAIDGETERRLERIARQQARIAEVTREIEASEREAAALRQMVALDRETIAALDVRTPEGAAVRERLVRRSDELDAILSRQQALRRELLSMERDMD